MQRSVLNSLCTEGETDKEMNYYPTVRQECCWMNSICFRNANPHAKRILIKPGFQLTETCCSVNPRAWDQRCLLALVSRCWYHSVPTPWGVPVKLITPSRHGAAEQLCSQPFSHGPPDVSTKLCIPLLRVPLLSSRSLPTARYTKVTFSQCP